MTHPQIFRDVRNYVSTTYGITSQSHAANHHRLLSHVTLCRIECSKQNSSCHVRTLKQNWNHTLEVKGQGHSRPVVVKASTLTLVKFHQLVSKILYVWLNCTVATDIPGRHASRTQMSFCTDTHIPGGPGGHRRRRDIMPAPHVTLHADQLLHRPNN